MTAVITNQKSAKKPNKIPRIPTPTKITLKVQSPSPKKQAKKLPLLTGSVFAVSLSDTKALNAQWNSAATQAAFIY